MNTVFCIDCQEEVEVQTILCGEGHLKLYPVFDDNGIQVGSEVDCCEFPSDLDGWATCPPPEEKEAREQWDERIGRPYTVDLLENQEQAEEEFVNVMVELEVMEV